MEVITLSNRLHDIIRSAQVDPNDIRIIESSSVLYLWNNDINHYMDEAGISYNSALNRILETYNTRNKDYCVVYPEDLYISENINYSSEYETIQAIFEAYEKLTLKDVTVGNKELDQKAVGKVFRSIFWRKHSELNLDSEQKIRSYYDKSIKECNNAIKKIDDELMRIKKQEANSQDEFGSEFFNKLTKSIISFAISVLHLNPVGIVLDGIDIASNTGKVIYTYSNYEKMLNSYKHNLESCINILEKNKQDDINKLKRGK